MKAKAIVCIGNSSTQQVVMMVTNDKEIVGVHKKQHSFFLAEVEDDEDYLIIKVHKNTLKSAREHYKECEKNGAEKGVDLNYCDWQHILFQKIWSFIKY